MFEEELVDLTGYFDGGGHTLNSRRSKGWALVAAVWDTRGDRLIGCLRMAGTDDMSETVTELEESLAAA